MLFGKRLRSGLLLLSIVSVAACATDGKDIDNHAEKAERVSIMDQKKPLEADASLKGRIPDIPKPLVNFTWPQAGYNSEHLAPSVDISQTPNIVWTKKIGKGSSSDFKILSRPVVTKGVIYTLDARGLVAAFSAKDGAGVWTFDTTPEDTDNQAMGGGISADGNNIYVTTGFGDVCALEAKTGKLLWRKSLMKPLRAAPTIADNRAYIVTVDNELNVLDATTGDILWKQAGITESATIMGASSPAVHEDSVVVAYNSGEIFGLRAQNGRVSWNYSLAAPAQLGALPAIADIRGFPVISDGKIYAISHSGRMAAIDMKTGDRAWEADIGGIETPVVAGDTVFVYGNDGNLIALTRDTGRPMWVVKLPQLEDPEDSESDRIFWSGPVLAGNVLWMTNSAGSLVGYSPNDGSQLENIDLEHPVYLSPIVAGRTMYVVADDGELIALR